MGTFSAADPAPQPHTASELFVGRQPILDRAQRLHAYELLFRTSGGNHAAVTNDLQATATVITNAFSELAIGRVLGPHRGFINLDRRLLLSDVIEILPKGQVVLELLETIEPDHEVVARCRDLRQKGYTLALDDIVQLGPAYEELLPFIDIVKVDLHGIERRNLSALARQIRRLGKTALAEKVDSHEQMEYCRDLGFDLFQGYFFAKPEVIKGRKLDHAQMVLMNLMTLIEQDADSDRLVDSFKLQPGLSLNLLRLTNSAACGLGVRVTSLRHAITVLGRRQLMRWLQLLLFVGEAPPAENPLLQLAASRGRLMELLTFEIDHKAGVLGEHAFMTGILSLTPALLGQPIEEIVAGLPIGAEVEAALLKQAGLLGALLALVQKIELEAGVVDAAALAKLRLSTDSLNSSIARAIAWANELGYERG
ncbi:EAL domain-containing protein [Aromatoleum evansii]|nr:EAL domain-containing protein [Aromatoleum evansii]